MSETRPVDTQPEPPTAFPLHRPELSHIRTHKVNLGEPGVYPFFLVPSIHAVLAPNLWAVPTQPYSRHEKWCWSLRATRSTITRLPSGSPASRSTSFRSGAFGVGVGTAHGCTWRVGGTSAHPRSASDPSFGVRSRIHPHMRAHGPVRNTFTRGPAPASAASARSRLSRDLRPRG